jgi:hypothetical protein
MECTTNLDVFLKNKSEDDRSEDQETVFMSSLSLSKYQKDAIEILEKPFCMYLLTPKEGLSDINILEKKPINVQKIYRTRQLVDCLDTSNNWLESTIMEVKQDKVFIHYNGWPSRWDEWIPIDSKRLAPVHTHTNGPRK